MNQNKLTTGEKRELRMRHYRQVVLRKLGLNHKEFTMSDVRKIFRVHRNGHGVKIANEHGKAVIYL